VSDPVDPSVTEPESIAGTLEETDVVLASIAQADTLFVELEEVDELAVEIADEQGLRGPPGRDGAVGGRMARTCLTAVTGGQVLRAVGAEFVRPASALEPSDAFAIIGVALHGASPGDDVEIVPLGNIEDSVWQFVPDLPVFVGATGLLTQTVQSNFTFVRGIGFATSPTTAFVDLRTPIFLAQG